MKCDSSKWLVSGVSIVAACGKLFINREEGKKEELPLPSRDAGTTTQEL